MLPIIGVVSKPTLTQQMPDQLWKELYVKQDFADVLADHGAACISIIPQSIKIDRDKSDDADLSKERDLTDIEKLHLTSQISLCDGIILQGGLSSHKYEVFIAKYCIQNDIPLLGVCAGFNNIARAIGLDVTYSYQLSVKHNTCHRLPCHNIYIRNNALHLPYTGEIMKVNSLHEMFLPIEATYDNTSINIEATTEEAVNTVEAFSVKDNIFCLAVKWHPELLPNDKLTTAIFERFLSLI